MDDRPSSIESDAAGQSKTPHLVLVTGMSGAGRSTALNCLEDLGYEAVDNLPFSLLGPLIRASDLSRRLLAVGIDVRTRDFGVGPFLEELDALLDREDVSTRLVFMDCDDEILQRRYSQTRRRHPLAKDMPVPDAIRVERQRLARLRDRADPVIDTTDFTETDLRGTIDALFSGMETAGMAITVLSFAYGQGLPRQADLVFDVRFLRNPHYIEDLRPLTGAEAPVGDYIAADPDFAPFLADLTTLLARLLPRYRREGKSYLTIALGCTGGRHRSVFVAERLADWLAGEDYRVRVRHREIGVDRVRA